MTTLSEALDRVWHDTAPRRISAATALVDMDDDAILDMLGRLIVADAGDWLTVDDRCEPHVLHLRYRGATAASPARLGNGLDKNAIIRLIDLNRALVVEDQGFAKMWGDVREYSADSILAAEQFARDHADSLLFLPSEMRQSRLGEVSASLGVPKELLCKLVVRFGASVRR
jgi:hypothetical protein